MGKVTFTSLFVAKSYNLLGHILRKTFALAAPKRLPADRTVGGTDLLIFSGYRGAKMMKALLLSIYYRWDNIPRVTIVSDGTPKEVLDTAMQFWPYPYEIKHWEDCAAWHRTRGHTAIIDFAHVNTYARKLLCVLAEAERRPVLYCDTDVLWFAQPRLPEPAPNRCTMRMSMDKAVLTHRDADVVRMYLGKDRDGSIRKGNVDGTRNVATACAERHVRLVHCSSHHALVRQSQDFPPTHR